MDAEGDTRSALLRLEKLHSALPAHRTCSNARQLSLVAHVSAGCWREEASAGRCAVRAEVC